MLAMTLLTGKVAVITGAGTGLGRSYAQLLAREGAAIVVNDYAPEPAQAVVEEIRAAASGIAILEAALGEFGQVDILINNAGILRDRSLLKMEERDFDDVLRVHL